MALLTQPVDMHSEVEKTKNGEKVIWMVDYAGKSVKANGWESRLSYWEKTQ